MKIRNNKNQKRKTVSIILAAAIMLTTMFCNVPPAEAATQNDAVAWAKAQIGKGLDYDHVYGNQCVDLIKYYYNYFGVAGYAMGNANAYMSNSLPPNWQRVYGGYQPGDVAVWKTNHSCSTCGTTSYGHVGIITAVNGSRFSAVNQNFNSKSYCTLNDFNVSALACAIRPKYTPVPPPVANVSFAEYRQNGVWNTNAELYIKVMNPDRANVSAVGCYLYDADGKLLKSYSESHSFNTSYVNYTCNFNSDMKYTLEEGTTYKVVLYAVVGGKEYKDTMRSFKTTGNSNKTTPVPLETKKPATERPETQKPETGKPETQKPDQQVADGNALASIAEREYNTYKGQTYANQYGTSPWCCNFVSWCARQAGITTDVMTSTATVQTMYDSLINNCGASIVSSPQRGDLVFYKYTDYDSERYHHIGIMTGPDETVQGNVNNTWWKGRPEALNSIKQITYVRPAYNGVYVPSDTAYFSSFKVNKVEETNAEVYIKVENPKRETVTQVGCSLYDKNGSLLKTYAEEYSFTTSYVNYTCNFNTDMGYQLTPGTTYQFSLYAVVGGKKLTDSMRSFTTSGSQGGEDRPATAPEGPIVTEEPTVTENPAATENPVVTEEPIVTEKPTATEEPIATEEPAATVKPKVKPTAKPSVNHAVEPDDEEEDEGEPIVISLKKPGKVTRLRVKSRSNRILVSWNFKSSSKRSGYQLQYASNRSFTKSKKTLGLGYYTNHKTLKKMKKGKIYYVRVREYNRAAGMTKYGKWSAVKKVKVR